MNRYVIFETSGRKVTAFVTDRQVILDWVYRLIKNKSFNELVLEFYEYISNTVNYSLEEFLEEAWPKIVDIQVNDILDFQGNVKSSDYYSDGFVFRFGPDASLTFLPREQSPDNEMKDMLEYDFSFKKIYELENKAGSLKRFIDDGEIDVNTLEEQFASFDVDRLYLTFNPISPRPESVLSYLIDQEPDYHLIELFLKEGADPNNVPDLLSTLLKSSIKGNLQYDAKTGQISPDLIRILKLLLDYNWHPYLYRVDSIEIGSLPSFIQERLSII